MIVSIGNKTFERSSHRVIAKRNGSFVDIHFKQDKTNKWIAIKYTDLIKMLALLKHGDWVRLIAEYDEVLLKKGEKC